MSKLDNLVIMEDINIYVEDHSNIEATIFNDTMQAPGLKQNVNIPMHHQGNILDLIFTEVNSDLKQSS